jgi:hypothetical protein
VIDLDNLVEIEANAMFSDPVSGEKRVLKMLEEIEQGEESYRG